jgi:hypothetical protein
MEHIRQRLGVHKAMFDGYLKQKAGWRFGVVLGFRQPCAESMVERLARTLHVVPHLIEGRPVLRLIGRQTSADRINSECEQAVQLRMKGSEPENPFP